MNIDLTEAYVVDKDGITLGESGASLISNSGTPSDHTITGAKEGDIFFSSSTGDIYTYKSSLWVKNIILDKTRSSIACSMNGTMGNGDFIRYTALSTNYDLMIPMDSIIEIVTFSNNKSSADFDIKFYKNGTEITADLKEVRSSKNGTLEGFSGSFLKGDSLWMKYVDKGQNATDLNLVVWLKGI